MRLTFFGLGLDLANKFHNLLFFIEFDCFLLQKLDPVLEALLSLLVVQGVRPLIFQFFLDDVEIVVDEVLGKDLDPFEVVPELVVVLQDKLFIGFGAFGVVFGLEVLGFDDLEAVARTTRIEIEGCRSRLPSGEIGEIGEAYTIALHASAQRLLVVPYPAVQWLVPLWILVKEVTHVGLQPVMLLDTLLVVHEHRVSESVGVALDKGKLGLAIEFWSATLELLAPFPLQREPLLDHIFGLGIVMDLWAILGNVAKTEARVTNYVEKEVVFVELEFVPELAKHLLIFIKGFS